VLLSLVDSLRCPAGHEESPLVLSVEAWSDQRVVEGVLGCPVCHARYPIHHGAAHFTATGAFVRRDGSGAPPDATRLAAQLSLEEPGGIVLLAGRHAAAADLLVEFGDVTCLLLDAPLTSSAAAVNLEVADRLPLVDSVLKGAAIDGARASAPFLAEIARCVRPLGRLVGPTQLEPPPGCHVIARDDKEWVAEVEEFSPRVPLRRAVPG
jgi:uncharacterized protein YbaR (Trm112 family)